MTSVSSPLHQAPFAQPGTIVHSPPMEKTCLSAADDPLADLTLGDGKSKEEATKSQASIESIQGQNRLAAVNQFTLDPNEPQRGLQELVHELMKELGAGQ
jgi:hypothetical protein